MNAHPSSTHRYSLRIYYEDTDAGGIVYHANYLRFAERGRTEALRDAGIPHAALVEQHGLMFVVHRAEIDYVSPARIDDIVVVETETLDVSGASVLLRQTMRGPRGVCAVARIKLACVRTGDDRIRGDRVGGNRPARIPPAWRTALAAMRDDIAP